MIVPCDPLRPRRPDPHFADEAEAARNLGLEVGLVDHDQLERARTSEDASAGLFRISAGSEVVYRGWMVTADAYGRLERALQARGAALRTTAADYRRAHELPGWQHALEPLTPEACWTTGSDLDAFTDCLRRLGTGAAVLRDHTKSLKHHWHEAAYIPDVTDEAAARTVAGRFLELRGDAFDGGLVVRRFEEFVGPEARTWWVDGRHVLTSAHPDTPDELPTPPPGVLAEVAASLVPLDLRFVTVDLVRRADGVWRLVELGDGQVSDRPRSCPAADLVSALVGAPAGGPGRL